MLNLLKSALIRLSTEHREFPGPGGSRRYFRSQPIRISRRTVGFRRYHLKSVREVFATSKHYRCRMAYAEDSVAKVSRLAGKPVGDAELERLQRQSFSYFLHETNPGTGSGRLLAVAKRSRDHSTESRHGSKLV